MYARGEHSTAPTQKTPKNDSLRAKNKKGTIYHEVCAESSFIPVATLDLDSLPDSIKNSFFKIFGGGVSTGVGTRELSAPNLFVPSFSFLFFFSSLVSSPRRVGSVGRWRKNTKEGRRRAAPIESSKETTKVKEPMQTTNTKQTSFFQIHHSPIPPLRNPASYKSS